MDTSTYRLPSRLSELKLKIKQRDLRDFERDESGGLPMPVAAVLAPKTERQLAEIVRQYAKHKRPLTISSANTGLSRGAVPSRANEEVLSMRSFTPFPIGIEQDSQEKSIVRAPAGVTLMDVQNFVEAKGLYYPPDPTERSALIGGTIATNASGPRTFKYGPTRDWVLALRIVLANGEILAPRRGEVFADHDRQFQVQMQDGSMQTLQIPFYSMPLVKNTAGYYSKPGMDLIDLFIGSEGTLGIITECELALISKPTDRYSGNVFFLNEEAARGFAKKIRALSLRGGRRPSKHFANEQSIPLNARTRNTSSKSGRPIEIASASPRNDMCPSLLEYFDEASVQIMREKFGRIGAQAKAAIYFEQELPPTPPSPSRGEGLIEAWRKIMLEHGAVEIQEAMNDKEREMLREQRHSIPEEVNRKMATVQRRYSNSEIGKVATDIAVPEDKFEDMIAYYKKVLAEYRLDHLIWGHIGNCHVHVNMLPQDPAQYALAKERLLDFARKANELGGTITAEHGTGKIKVPQLKIMMGKETMAQMAAVKSALDPAGILGRGNIFVSLRDP